MWKKIGFFLLIAGLIAGYIGYDKYQKVFAPNVPDQLTNPYLEIPTGASYEEIKRLLKNNGMLIEESGFDWVAEQMNYKKTTMRTGRFKIEPGWSNRQLVGHLRGGKQAAVKVILNNERLLEEVAGKVAGFIEPDSTSLIQLFKNEKRLRELGLNQHTLMTLFIPNTYELYWNVSGVDFLERMAKEYQKFWDKNNRKAKASKLGMSPQEVYTLASIVERETLQKDEKPRIAGVYLNRLKKNILLQADPTVVFALRQFDLKRVLNKHLKFDSPFNTYMYAGLPPGPISMSSISSIDAVLNHENHNYIYFCARGDGTGYHSFAKTLQGHNQNAQIYRQNLKKRGLR